MGRGRGRRDNELIGQTVRISQGPYKGECDSERDGRDLAPRLTVSSPTHYRLYRGSEGCHGVYGQSGAALHLSDHLCGQTAFNHHVGIQHTSPPSCLHGTLNVSLLPAGGPRDTAA